MGNNRVFRQSEDWGFRSEKKVNPLVLQTEETKPENHPLDKNVKKIRRFEDCIVKCKDPKINFGWLGLRSDLDQLDDHGVKISNRV